MCAFSLFGFMSFSSYRVLREAAVPGWVLVVVVVFFSSLLWVAFSGHWKGEKELEEKGGGIWLLLLSLTFSVSVNN